MFRKIDSCLLVLAFLALVLVPWDSFLASKVSLSEILLKPSLAHPFGTDNLGRDLLSRIAMAIRGGVLPLWGGVLLGSLLGYAIACVSILLLQKFREGKLVLTFQIVTSFLASIPIGVVVFVFAVWWEKAGLSSVLAALVILLTVRSYLELNDLFWHDQKLGFWQAHESVGGSLQQRIWKYGFLGSWRAPLLETLSFNLIVAVGIESSLSYLGFGVQEPQASFGNILASHFDLYLKGQWSTLIVVVGAFWITVAFPRSLLRLAKTRQDQI